jgi:hypothetical protein
LNREKLTSSGISLVGSFAVARISIRRKTTFIGVGIAVGVGVGLGVRIAVGVGVGLGGGDRSGGGEEQYGIINARSPVIATTKLPIPVRIPGSVVQKDCLPGSGVGSAFIGPKWN